MYHHERFLRGFEWRQHSQQAPTQHQPAARLPGPQPPAHHPDSECCRTTRKTELETLMGLQGDVFRHAHTVIEPFVTKMSHILTQRGPEPYRELYLNSMTSRTRVLAVPRVAIGGKGEEGSLRRSRARGSARWFAVWGDGLGSFSFRSRSLTQRWRP